MGWFGRHKTNQEAEDTRRMVKHAAQVHGVPAEEVVHTVLDEDDDELDEELAEPRRHRLGVWIAVMSIGLVFGGAVFFLWWLANGPAEAGPSADSGLKAIEKSIQPTPPELPTLTGRYISLSYPQVFDAVKTLGNLPNTAERYSIGSKANYRRSIVVTVENNTASADEDSGYKYRSLNPALYRVESIKLPTAAGSGTVMIKNDNTERTLYWAHAGKVVVISVTSTNAGDDLASYMATIAGTVRWAG